MTAAAPQTIHIAVMALGGQGGGVLIDWLVDLAEHAGWTAQATSVAGVAQRTGATIYYVEMVAPTPGREPILALMPVPGEVDVVIAAELMEAGRAVERGFVTPQRTLVVASRHRAYAVPEKIAPGNALADSAAVQQIVAREARQLVIDDFQALAAAARQRDLGGAVRCVGRQRRPALHARAIRSRGRAQRCRRAGEPRAHCAPLQKAPAHVRPRHLRPIRCSRRRGRCPIVPPATRCSPCWRASVSSLRARRWDWLGEGLSRVVDWQDVRLRRRIPRPGRPLREPRQRRARPCADDRGRALDRGGDVVRRRDPRRRSENTCRTSGARAQRSRRLDRRRGGQRRVLSPSLARGAGRAAERHRVMVRSFAAADRVARPRG